MSAYEPGHAPTNIDVNNATLYGYYRVQKDICDADPATRQWVSQPCPFPCPDVAAEKDGAECACGYCAFTEAGCKQYSHYPYFDCTRIDVPCNIGGRTTCSMCQFAPKITDSALLKDIHGADGPYLTEEERALVPKGQSCFPGDAKAVVDAKAAADLGMTCTPPPVATPYLVDGAPVECVPDADGNGKSADCQVAGSLCSSSTTNTKGTCLTPTNWYTEWRHGFQQWPDEAPRDACVAVVPDVRRFCEMPWTRSAMDGKSADDYNPSMNDRIESSWQSRWRPPFYYDEHEGRCLITRSYCKNSPVKHGGYGMGYGSAQDYFLWSDCKTHHMGDAQVWAGADCCTTFWASMFEFFFGRTLLADVTALVHGQLSPAQFFTRARTPNYALFQFLSDARLKHKRRVVRANAFANALAADDTPGVDLVEFEWTDAARALYGLKRGRFVGVLAQDVAALFPQHVHANENGHLWIRLDPQLLYTDRVYRAVMLAAKHMRDASSRESALQRFGSSSFADV